MTAKLREMFKIFLAIAITLILTSCSVLSDISSSLIELNVTYDDIGEIYCNPIDINHIAGDDGVINYMDNEILVVAQPSVTKEEMAVLANKYNAEIVGFIEKTGDYQLQLADVHTKDDLQSIVNEIETESKIESACLNYVYEISEDTINYGKQWKKDLKNYTDCKGKSWGIEAIRAPEAWKLLEENADKINKNLRIGLIDEGFDLDHEDLGFAERFDNYNSNLQDDKKDHGTHVAGTMAASSDNNIGICGVYPYGKRNLYGISFDGINRYNENTVNLMMNKIGMAELIFRNVKVINCSFGYSEANICINYRDIENKMRDEYILCANNLADFLHRCINDGYDFLIVVAAGNCSNNKHKILNSEEIISVGWVDAEYESLYTAIKKDNYPDIYNRIIVVGSVDDEYNISRFSNIGKRVDIYAPGEEIFSTKPNNKYGATFKKLDENGVMQTYLYSGTSMASPHVAGIAAMVWAADSKLTGEQVKIIVCNSESYKSPSVKMVDAKMAVMAALKISENHSEAVSEPNNPNYGSIMLYIVDKNDENIRISGARITAESLSDGSAYDVYSDNSGHFELILPEGLYNITINADGYEAYSYQENIQCSAQQVNYIDWAKLVKIESSSDSFVPDGEYIKVDFDNDGKNEIFAIEDISTYKHKLWYYDDDLSKTQLEEIDDSAFCKLKVIVSEYGNHVYLNKIQNENCPIDNIYFSIYINKNNKPYCCNSGRGPLEYTDSNELIWHYGGHNENGVLVGIDYKLEYNVSKNEYDYFNANAIIVTQSDLDNMAQEIYDLSYTVFKDLSTSDQSTFYLGAARLGSILKYGGYLINDFKSDFLKKYALDDWVHIDIKFNFYKDNSDVYFYIEYASIRFDDNINYINENSDAKGIYYNPQFNEKQVVLNNLDNLVSDYMSEEQFTQSCANAMAVHIAATATIAQAYVDGKFEVSHTYDNPTDILTGTYDIPTGWIDGEGTLLTKNGKTLDLTTGLGSDFKGYMYVYIDEFYAVMCAVWSSKPIPQECKSLLIENGEYEGLTKEEALKYGVGCYPMPY